jgi:3',5'-cyclic AMP phosphodiesterase CpdA
MGARKAGFPFLLAVILVLFVLALASCAGEGAGGQGGDGGATEGGGGRADNRFSFLVCGDPHGRTDLLERIIGQLKEGEFLVIVGDLTTGTGMAEMRKMKDFLDQKGIEYHVIPGDNDMPGGDASNFKAVFGPDYYSLDVQDSHLVFLNDAVQGVGCPPEELSWLQGDLADAAGRLVLGFAHVPPGAPVKMENLAASEPETRSGRAMLDELEKAGAAVIFCGHLHVYMLYSSGPPRIVITGGAGASPHLSEQAGGYHHFLRVRVQGDQVSEEMIRL